MSPLLVLQLLPFVTSVHCTIYHLDFYVVNALNRVRRTVYPTAANMNYVSWTHRLAAKANKAAGECAAKFHGNGSEGQTYYKSNAAEHIDEKRLIAEWTKEQLSYSFGTDACTLQDACINYRQMIDPAVTEFGCAYSDSCIIGGVRSKVYVCYYDKKVSTTPLPGKLYKTGRPGSMCFFAESKKSIFGLCQATNVIHFLTPTCEIAACPSCKAVKKATCECGDPLVSPCATCGQLGTPCLNGGEDKSTSETECICKCKDGFKGHQCQIPDTVYKNGIYLELTYGNLTNDAVDPGSFETIWEDLQWKLAGAINNYCTNNKTNAQSCCGTIVPGSLAEKIYISTPNLKYVEYGMADDGKNLMVAVYPDVQAHNTLCNAVELDDTKIKSYKHFVDTKYPDKYIAPTGPGGDATNPDDSPTGPGGDATNPGVSPTGPGGDATNPDVSPTGPGGDATNPGSTTGAPSKPKSGVRSDLSALLLLALHVTLALLLAF